MKKNLLISILLLLLTSNPVLANPVSIATGRAALFNNGAPTCSGIIAANSHFRVAVQEAPTNQEANFFYALTRLLVSGLEQGHGSNFSTLLDVLQSFGITRTANEDILNEPVYINQSEFAGTYFPPATVPEAGLVSQFFNMSFAVLLDDILENLSKVDNTIAITLTSLETGDTAVEIDFGDVLLFKSMVNTLKGLVFTIFAYNMDGIDTAELIQLFQADSFRIQKDLLDNYPSALSLITSGASQLAIAKSALISAVDQFHDALNFITTETDNQNNDLFSFNEEDLDDALDALGHFQEVKASFNEDRPAIFSMENNVERYDFNAIFGSASKNPLDIRDSMPPFNTDNEPDWESILGTSFLNGFLPDKLESYGWIPEGVVSLVNKVTHTLPSGTTQDKTPTYAWNEDPNATWYRLFVWDSSKEQIFAQWYAATNLCSDGSCSVSLELELASGNYEWFVKSWNDYGSIWSDGMAFTIQGNDSPPSKVTHTSPSGATQDSTPTYSWNEDPASTWYKLWIGKASGDRIFAQWYDASNICSGGICSIKLDSELPDGIYEWYIKSWNNYGKVWSDGMSFEVE